VADARLVLDAGAGGVVFGCLTAHGAVDAERVEEMVALCRAAKAEAVFHRAIDLAAEPLRALHQLADLGVARVLTSGISGPGTAIDLGEPGPAWPIEPGWHNGGDGWARRMERVRAMVDAAAGARGEIGVLVGGGIRAENARTVVDQTRCDQLHSSARAGSAFSGAAVRALVAAVR
jgi:copper homeostasis protein